MRRQELPLIIDPASETPLYLQIVEGIVGSIQKGLLAPGSPLPGRRVLAESLDVSRTTVVTAYEELLKLGWIEIRERSGTYVSEEKGKTSAIPNEQLSPEKLMTIEMPTRHDLVTSQMVKVIKLSEGLPDARLIPADDMGKAYKSALLRKAAEPLEYGSPQGHEQLRQALSEFLLGFRKHRVSPSSILVTHGNRMALGLICRGLLSPGDAVAVEDPGNPVVWESFKEAKARLVGISVDDEGLDIGSLETHLQRERIQLLYLTSRYQTPTTVTLSEHRRNRLLELAKEYRFAIIEDDSEAEYLFEGPLEASLAARADAGTVIYISSFSRLLAPGVRLGFLTGPQSVVERLTVIRQRIEWQGDQVLELAIAELLMRGKILRHIQQVRSIYHARRDATLELLEELFGSSIQVNVPTGGLSLWLQTDPSIDLEPWRKICADQGIYFQLGRMFTLDRHPIRAFRLGYAALDPMEMHETLSRMREAVM